MQQVNLDIVGDGAIGKNVFLIRWRYNYFQSEFNPIPFDQYTQDILVDDKSVTVVAHYTGTLLCGVSKGVGKRVPDPVLRLSHDLYIHSLGHIQLSLRAYHFSALRSSCVHVLAGMC